MGFLTGSAEAEVSNAEPKKKGTLKQGLLREPVTRTPDGQFYDSVMTITTTDPEATLEEKAKEYGLEDTLPKPLPVDMTDITLQQTRNAKLQNLMTSHGRKSTFLSGQSGKDKKTLLGGR